MYVFAKAYAEVPVADQYNEFGHHRNYSTKFKDSKEFTDLLFALFSIS